jgi:micrococcal nuclease
MALVAASLFLASCGDMEVDRNHPSATDELAPKQKAEAAEAAESHVKKGSRPTSSETIGREGSARVSRNKGTPARVTRIVDGDTIEVRFHGRIETIRLIGVDTPETVHPSRPVECFGAAASNFTARTLQDKAVGLEFDVERTDRYGRTLAYVWSDGRLFNRVLVARGFAQVATYPPNVKYVDVFLKAQKHARDNGRGLWGSCQDDGDSVSSAGGGASTKCDPNYKGACIPLYPPDVDCGDVPAKGFRSIGSDPHGFDGDGDGVACES